MMSKIFDYPFEQYMMTLFPPREDEGPPKLDWRAAQAAGERLMAEQAAKQGFKIAQPVALNHLIEEGLYNYTVLTDRSFPDKKSETVFFDADTGAFHAVMHVNTGHSGLTITNWLRALHMAHDPLDYLVYRVFVFADGPRRRDAFGHRRLYLVEETRRAKIHRFRVSKRQMQNAEGGAR